MNSRKFSSHHLYKYNLPQNSIINFCVHQERNIMIIKRTVQDTNIPPEWDIKKQCPEESEQQSFQCAYLSSRCPVFDSSYRHLVTKLYKQVPNFFWSCRKQAARHDTSHVTLVLHANRSWKICALKWYPQEPLCHERAIFIFNDVLTSNTFPYGTGICWETSFDLHWHSNTARSPA